MPEEARTPPRSLKSATELDAFVSSNSLDPPDQARGSNVHGKTLQRKWEEAQKSRRRHFKDFHALEHRKRIVPFRARPVVPQFPEPAANPARREEAVEPPSKSFRKIPDERRQPKPSVHRIEQQHESDPHQHEQPLRDPQRQHERKNQAQSAKNDQNVLRGP